MKISNSAVIPAYAPDSSPAIPSPAVEGHAGTVQQNSVSFSDSDTGAILELSSEGMAASEGFRHNNGINDTGPATTSATATAPAAPAALISSGSTISKLAVYLNDMGFYSGGSINTLTTEFKRSLECFQRAYGSRNNSSDVITIGSGIPDYLVSWIENVGASYYSHVSDSRTTTALKGLGFSTAQLPEAKKNFARIWTFLERGMRCNANQIAGIMGNIKQESNFNPTSVNAKGAYGILQWLGPRNNYLTTYADKYGYDKSSMGTQLAYFKYELSNIWGKGDVDENAPNSALVNFWNIFINDNACKNSYISSTSFFMDNIEGIHGSSKSDRTAYAKTIYEAIS